MRSQTLIFKEFMAVFTFLNEFINTQNKDYCSKYGSELKISFRKASDRYLCLECNYYIPKDTKSCKRHGVVGFNVEKHEKKQLNYRCGNCNHKEITTYGNNKSSEDSICVNKIIIFYILNTS